MKTAKELRNELINGVYDQRLSALYCCDVTGAKKQAGRYLRVLDALSENFGEHAHAALFSAPGRTEIGGNHTDHQHGSVLCGSVSMDMIAAAGENGTGVIRLQSEGYAPLQVDTGELSVQEEEKNTTASLVRGLLRAFSEKGANLYGLDICVSSEVPKGSGISSSAAFEVLIGNIFNTFFLKKENALSTVEIARAGKFAENVYFGKPSGLMDQMASSVGGVTAIDFKDPENPVVKKISFSLEKAGLALCLVDSGADHADLTAEYAAVPKECRDVAALFGKEVLREVPEETFRAGLPKVRGKVPDRALLRAFHFYQDSARAQKEADALEQENIAEFLRLVNESGDSSFEYLQNITPAGETDHQEVALAIALCREALSGRDAVRVHGGGFAGTVQAFVPAESLPQFVSFVESVLGPGSCHVMAIRPEGGICLSEE